MDERFRPPVDEAELFLLTMQEFGLFDEVERHLPAEFAAIYEIARVLERPDHPLAQRLAPLFWLGQSETPSDVAEASSPVKQHFTAEEYDAELIRHYRDVVHIYPHQFLLPEEVFYHRLAERSLWMPVARPPHVYGYQTHGNVYAPDIRKQKVYVLFDTSASMQSHWRIQLAKAITYLFLRRNQAELGEIFLRTFDVQPGELHHAYDQPSFERLLRTVLRLQAVGQGTALEQAIVTAAEEIRRRPALVQSEILLITDGIAYLHVERLRQLLGTDIRLHAVRLGAGSEQLTSKQIEAFAYRDEGELSQQYRKLLDEKRHLEQQLSIVSSEHQRRLLQQQVRLLEQQSERLFQHLAQQAQQHYASALRELCTVYVPVEDMPIGELLHVSPERSGALQRAAERLLEQLRQTPTAEDCHKAAALAEYLDFLGHHVPESSSLRELAHRLRRQLRTLFRSGQEHSMQLNPGERRILVKFGILPASSLGSVMRMVSLRFWFRRLRLWLRRLIWRFRWCVNYRR